MKVGVMANQSPKLSEEELQLGAKLRDLKDKMKVVFERNREGDEELRIRDEEQRIQERLRELNAEPVESKLLKSRLANLEAENKKIEAELKAVKTENEHLKQQVEAFSKDANEKRTSAPEHASNKGELELLRRKYSDQNQCAESQQHDPKAQEKELRVKEEEIQKLTQSTKCLKDKITAAQQIMTETQLRQLDELHSLTEETRQIKNMLLALTRQQQQPAAAEEHRQGKYVPASHVLDA